MPIYQSLACSPVLLRGTVFGCLPRGERENTYLAFFLLFMCSPVLQTQGNDKKEAAELTA
jgi:hypothetical protein